MPRLLPWIALPIYLAIGTAAAVTPTIDGVAKPGEWAGARREKLVGGGEVWLLRAGNDLYVAVEGSGTGFPSLCVGDADRVEVLHASAALGTVAYQRGAKAWSRGPGFEWRVRDLPEPAPTLSTDRESFLKEQRWLANTSRTGAPFREFRIILDAGRRFLGVVFLSTNGMQAAYWPASVNDGCRDMDLLRGEAPHSVELTPSRWHDIE
ncbi:hypothetical protein IP90_00918 [Luteimonas cucumeris]|uniref:Uncharacterized protein n=2 Tax=Luteimonas cucumeris TaxID=985012 RepID=A0A562LAW7_9GAMM|nr:hypothetical protein IP90_00918 [Luteimonas cucumeris]